MITLGEAIKRLRKAGGLTQRELSDRIEVDPTYVSHLENNRREPSLQLLKNIAEKLGIPAGVLLAVVIWADLPAEEQSKYQQIVEKLLEMGGNAQGELLIDEVL